MQIKLIDKLIPNSITKYFKRWIYDRRYQRKFMEVHGYALNEESPSTFSEKLFYRKQYGNFEEMAKFSDKYAVRAYVESKIGKPYLIPILGVYKKLTLNDMDKLPNQFVVKTTHGSGKKHIEIVLDKKSHNLKSLIEKMNHALTLDFGYERKELWYTKIDKKIIIEQLLPNSGAGPDDYKFHCFGNEKMYIVLDRGRFKEHKRSVFDENWQLTKVTLNSYPALDNIDKPINFDIMKTLAETLSADFDYIRVDFYNIKGKIYFGELTFSNANGMSKLSPENFDRLWGDLWNIDHENRQLYSK